MNSINPEDKGYRERFGYWLENYRMAGIRDHILVNDLLEIRDYLKRENNSVDYDLLFEMLEEKAIERLRNARKRSHEV